MIAVLFEVTVKEGKDKEYLAEAAALADSLKKAPGFIRSERFSSLAVPGKLLSLSFWRDEESVAQWRNLLAHRSAQGKGRAGIFEHYRITVMREIRSYTDAERSAAPITAETGFSPSGFWRRAARRCTRPWVSRGRPISKTTGPRSTAA